MCISTVLCIIWPSDKHWLLGKEMCLIVYLERFTFLPRVLSRLSELYSSKIHHVCKQQTTPQWLFESAFSEKSQTWYFMIETLPKNISLDVCILFFSQPGVFNKPFFFLCDKTPAWTAIKEQLKWVDQVFPSAFHLCHVWWSNHIVMYLFTDKQYHCCRSPYRIGPYLMFLHHLRIWMNPITNYNAINAQKQFPFPYYWKQVCQ